MNPEKFLNVLPILIVVGGVLMVIVWTIIARHANTLPLKSQRPDP